MYTPYGMDTGPDAIIDYHPLSISADELDRVKDNKNQRKWLIQCFKNWSKSFRGKECNAFFGIRIIFKNPDKKHLLGICLAMSYFQPTNCIKLKLEKKYISMDENAVTMEVDKITLNLDEIEKIEYSVPPVNYRKDKNTLKQIIIVGSNTDDAIQTVGTILERRQKLVRKKRKKIFSY